MEPAFIPEVPERVTREQLIDATRALGLEPHTVKGISLDASGVKVTVSVYNTAEPNLGDDSAFRRPFTLQTGTRVTLSIPVAEDGWPRGARPL